ncbi:hypothetical protein N7488_003639 [Penicillium malachiteum]|nr:hypothetical protein N7488_003639 [Penicillium malachiteum]
MPDFERKVQGAYRKMQRHYEIMHLEHVDETLATPLYVPNRAAYDDWLRYRRPIDKCAKLDEMSLYQVWKKISGNACQIIQKTLEGKHQVGDNPETHRIASTSYQASVPLASCPEHSDLLASSKILSMEP